MSDEELFQWFQVLLTADGGCSHCYVAIIDEACRKFPQYRDRLTEFLKKYQDSLS